MRTCCCRIFLRILLPLCFATGMNGIARLRQNPNLAVQCLRTTAETTDMLFILQKIYIALNNSVRPSLRHYFLYPRSPALPRSGAYMLKYVQ